MKKSCPTLNTGCEKYIPAKCIYYSGAALPCTGIIYNDTVDIAFKKVDQKICEITSRVNIESVLSLAGQITEVVIGDDGSAKPTFQSVPAAGETQITLPYKIMPSTETVFYQGVPVLLYPSNDFNYIPVYGPNSTTYIFSSPFEEGYSLKIDATKVVTETGQGGSIVGLGMQFVVKDITATTDMLYVSELGRFALAIQNGQPLTYPTVTQNGNILDFSQVGGVTTGEKVTIFYTNI